MDYGERSLFNKSDSNQTPKGLRLVTKKALNTLLSKINFLGNADNDDILLNAFVVLPLPLKNQVNVSVRKSFALDIGLNKVIGKSSQEKLVTVRKLFSEINNFGETSIPLKFLVIIRTTFTSELGLIKATKKTTSVNIMVNTNLKKSTECSNQDVVLKEIPIGTSAKAVYTIDQADLVMANWSILIEKNMLVMLRPDVQLSYENSGHIFLNCIANGKFSSGSLLQKMFSDADKSRLAVIYAVTNINNIQEKRPKTSSNNAKYLALVANIVGESSFSSLSACNSSVNFGSFLEMKSFLLIVNVLELCLINIKNNLVSNIVMKASSDEFTSDKTAMVSVLFAPFEVVKLKNMLEGLSALVLSLLTCFDSLVLAGVNCGVAGVKDYFNTNHKVVSVSVSLGELLDVWLNSLRKQTNKDYWKFNIKNANMTKWKEFKNAMTANTAMFSEDEHSETAANKENDSEISEKESIDSENEEDKMTAYITKIPEFNGEDIKTSFQEWLDQVTKTGDANKWNAARMLRTIPYFLKETAAFKTAFLEQFTNNNISITLQNHFRNIKQELSKSVITYIEKFNKLLRQICQLETNNYYSDAQILDQFITGLKDKLIKKVRPHASEDLNSAIQHAKRYEMAMEEANYTKLVNLTIRETSSAAEEKIDQLTKKVENYFTNQQQQQPQRYQPPQRQNQNNFISSSNNQPQNCHYYCRKLQRDQQNRSNQHYPSPQQSYYQLSLPPTYYLPRPQYQTDYYQPFPEIQLSQDPPIIILNLTILQYLKNRIFTILHSQKIELQIAENANLSDIFPFEFEANESLFLLSNAAANKQKAITAIYTEAEVKGKAIHLILNSRFAGSIITYQLMQQLKRNTPVGEIDNFLFTLDGITIPVKVLVMDMPQYQALVRNNWLQKANAKLDWETQELQLSYQGQHARVPATCEEEEKPVVETFMALESTSNWTEETKQTYFATNSYPEEPKTPG
ncbi:hypothetical protein G9A89_015134 [Geosiphon pyriformis]|nr:hypothetical protein G9A89_015134 [Geosiphon pyriformis]